jgi:hypothetical protein
VWLGSWGSSRTTVPQYCKCPSANLLSLVLGLTWCRTTSRLALAAPQADFGASCATSAAGRAEQEVLAVAGSLLSAHTSLARATLICGPCASQISIHIQPPCHPTTPTPKPTHPRPRPQDLPERISTARRQFKLPNASFSFSSSPPESQFNSPPVASILSPGERRHRRLTAHIFLSSLALRLDTGQVRPGQDKARECGTRQPCLA